jgi:hypothetical protein
MALSVQPLKVSNLDKAKMTLGIEKEAYEEQGG